MTTRRQLLPILSVLLSLSVLAAACGGTAETPRSASGSLGNPVDLSALPNSSESGQRAPAWFGAEVTPVSWVSTSLSPSLVVPGGSGSWTFTLSDLSEGTSSFGTRTYVEVGASTRIPSDLLQNGSTYIWTATSLGQQTVGGSFTVDVQMLDAQQVDSFGGVDVLLSSGEAVYSWSSHTMKSLGGPVGVSLRFQTSNTPSPGVPNGWKLTSSSGSPYQSVTLRPDGSAALHSQSGQVSSYRQGAGATWNPVDLSGEGLNTSGLAPVLLRNADSSWSVTSKTSTSKFVDDDGDGVANLTEIAADGAPMVQQQWERGLLRRVTDPVSNRSVQLIYGGESCPGSSKGFVAAPEGMLCKVSFWDGSTSTISYVGLDDGTTTIGRLTDFPEAGADGASVADVAYDRAGRITRTRSPLVAAAAASSIIGSDDPQFWSSIAYHPDGRVATVTEAAASAGAQRCIRSYDNEGNTSQVNDSCSGRMLRAVTFDGSTFFPVEVTSASGLSTRNTWDLATGQLRSTVDESNRVTTNEYENGNLIRTRGPSRDLTFAQVVDRSYDRTYVGDGEGSSMHGLDVTYWPSTTDRGADAVQELGPLLDGRLANSLDVNWESSPAGNSVGGWSGLMSGGLTVTMPGTYSFASGNDDARLRIANVACEDSGCSSLQLPAGPVAIRVEIESTTPAASIDLTWSGPDTGGVVQSIPTDRLHPQYGYLTETKVLDADASGLNSERRSRSLYSDPSTGRVTGVSNAVGTTSATRYEDDGWRRPVASELPAGNRVAQTWWGDGESAKAPCSGAKSVVQGGAIRQTITPGSNGGDGPSVQQWYSASGAISASRTSNGATQCLIFDRAQRVVGISTQGFGETSEVEIEFGVGSNPLVVATTETKGSTTSTSSVETDLVGRVVRSVDRNGIVTVRTYDPRTGGLATSTSTPPGSRSVVLAYSYDEAGRLTTTSLDGRVVAELRYGDYGLPVKVTYGNGAVSNFSVDAQNNLVGISTTAIGGTWSSSRVLSTSGVTSSSTLSSDGKSSTFVYERDANGRLTQVSLSAGLAPASKTWAYGYDVNSNRISQSTSTNGISGDSFTYSYDRADRLMETNDPAAAGGIEYDDRGNATRVGPDSFVYDAANLLVSATDGSTTVEYQRSASGSVIGKTTVVGSDSTTVRYGAGGFILDAQGNPTAQVTALPGGVQLNRTLGPTPASEWVITTVQGDRFVALDDSGRRSGDVSIFTPFGEQIQGEVSVDAARPDLSWKATEGNESAALRTRIVAMGQRVYVPALGRFIQVDPVVGGSANGYDYANQDPITFTDPSGQRDSSVMDWLGVALVAVASVGASLLVPASAGRATGMVIGAAVGVLAGGINVAVQYFTGGDMTIAVGSVAVGLLAGVVTSGVKFKARWAKMANTSSSEEVAVVASADVLADIEKASAVFDAELPKLSKWEEFLRVRSGSIRKSGAMSRAGSEASNSMELPTNRPPRLHSSGELDENFDVLDHLEKHGNDFGWSNPIWDRR